MRRRALVVVAVVAALVLGWAISFVADLQLYAYDDSCPQWEDEGSMAAPGSPYSAVMCAPQDPPLVWAWFFGVLVSSVLAIWVVRRRADRFRRALPGLALLVLVPSLLIGLLHVALPRDCFSGETRSGDCTRDRERR